MPGHNSLNPGRILKTMRLFIAVPIPLNLKTRLEELGNEIKQEGIKLVKPENMHITLKFLGETSEEELEAIKNRLKNVRFGNFSCRVKDIGVFPNENYIRVVWAGSEDEGQMKSLAEAVQESLGGKKERFSSHITIGRVKKKVDLKNFLEAHRGEELGSFEVSEFRLMKSELKKEGPEYSVVETYPAEGADA
ncbi:RNA 2',3'-cyclic phosphodiesterase [Candidatus Micrarchaeota archaeon]|nr:RNA 2',3'-cyclic phosphodiesterase [Candidatus Micrarchaeota archaeon]